MFAVSLSDEDIDRIARSSDGDLERMLVCIEAIHTAPTNGEALGAIARFRKETRLSAIRAVLEHLAQP